MEGFTTSTLCMGSFTKAPLKGSLIRKLYKTFTKKPLYEPVETSVETIKTLQTLEMEDFKVLHFVRAPL